MQPDAQSTQSRRLRELAALAGIMTRFCLVVLPLARAQLRGWQKAAAAIPDPELREQALATLRSERLSAAGAALFAATTRRHSTALVRALIAFQVAWDYLDTLAEQPAADPIANGVRLHGALSDALDGELPCADYYALHRTHDDGGYLVALVETCRANCATLPAYERVRATAAREAARAEVQGLNHAPADVREPALQRWAQLQRETSSDASWFELAAAASSSLGPLALLAAAADPTTTDATVQQVRGAYFPWIDALTTLLDSLVDREQDLVSGEMSFIGHYDSAAATLERLREVTARATAAARTLPHGERHLVLVAGMIAMHLSTAGAWLPANQAATTAVLRATQSSVTSLLLTLLRAWRFVQRERRYSILNDRRWDCPESPLPQR